MEFRPRRRPPMSIDNITPLVDCFCLLLIFFMISTTFDASAAIRVTLPEGAGEGVRREGRDLRVKVDRAGVLYLGKDRVSTEELAQKFREAAADDRATLVVVEADEDAAHKHVVAVMDRAKSSGLHKLAIATRKRP